MPLLLGVLFSSLWYPKPLQVFTSLVTAGSGLMLRLLLISSCLISAELQLNCLLLALGLQPWIPSLGGEKKSTSC